MSINIDKKYECISDNIEVTHYDNGNILVCIDKLSPRYVNFCPLCGVKSSVGTIPYVELSLVK